MNFSRLAVAAVTAWMAFLAIGYLVNAVLLADEYAALAETGVMRATAEGDALLPVGFAASLLGFFAFAYVYAKGYEGGSGRQEGLRFGVLVGLLLVCFGAVWNYVTFPLPGALLLAWVVDAIVEFAIYGMIVGAIYRPLEASVRRARA